MVNKIEKEIFKVFNNLDDASLSFLSKNFTESIDTNPSVLYLSHLVAFNSRFCEEEVTLTVYNFLKEMSTPKEQMSLF